MISDLLQQKAVAYTNRFSPEKLAEEIGMSMSQLEKALQHPQDFSLKQIINLAKIFGIKGQDRTALILEHRELFVFDGDTHKKNLIKLLEYRGRTNESIEQELGFKGGSLYTWLKKEGTFIPVPELKAILYVALKVHKKPFSNLCGDVVETIITQHQAEARRDTGSVSYSPKGMNAEFRETADWALQNPVSTTVSSSRGGLKDVAALFELPNTAVSIGMKNGGDRYFGLLKVLHMRSQLGYKDEQGEGLQILVDSHWMQNKIYEQKNFASMLFAITDMLGYSDQVIAGIMGYSKSMTTVVEIKSGSRVCPDRQKYEAVMNFLEAASEKIRQVYKVDVIQAEDLAILRQFYEAEYAKKSVSQGPQPIFYADISAKSRQQALDYIDTPVRAFKSGPPKRVEESVAAAK